MRKGDIVVLRDWVDVTRLARCKIGGMDAGLLRKHSGVYRVIDSGESTCGFFEGAWVRVELPNSSLNVYVKRCYFEKVPP